MMPFLTDDFGNPSSVDHPYGARAAAAVENSRETTAKVINAASQEVIFTSGATEADNLAIKGVAEAYRTKGRHIITCVTEHKAVLDTCQYLEGLGWSVSYIPVDKFGLVDVNKLESSITKETVLISIMFANNEIGTLAPIGEVGQVAKRYGIFFHSDAAQAVGHVHVDVDKLGIDLMSISGHKINGPKGIGALYIRGHNPRVKPAAGLLGGGQERGLRSGTLNVPGIVGLGKALDIADKEMDEEALRLGSWADKMKSRLESEAGAKLNGHPVNRLSHNLNLFFPGVESKGLIQLVSSQVAISASSACTTSEVEPSHVILALGYGPERAHSSIRIGLGRFNTQEEIGFATDTIMSGVRRLSKISNSELFLSSNTR
jgi:cysteine desulfurase